MTDGSNLFEARDPMVPPDQTPDEFLDQSLNPSNTLPARYEPEGTTPTDQEGEYTFYLRDGVAPYRTNDGGNYDVFSTRDGKWYLSNDLDPDRSVAEYTERDWRHHRR